MGAQKKINDENEDLFKGMMGSQAYEGGGPPGMKNSKYSSLHMKKGEIGGL